MSDYTQTTDFSAKDSLTPGDPEKIILGSDVDDELSAISTAIASKPDQSEIQNNTFVSIAASGTDTYTGGANPAITAYADNQEFLVDFANANTGAATLNIDSLGAKSIVLPNGDPLSAGDISAGMKARLVYDGTNFVLISGTATGASFPRGHRAGLKTSQAADADHDITIAAGECDNQDHDKKIILGSEITKRIDANWAAGDDAGGFPSALSLSADTWYHVFVIMNPTSGAVDAGFDTALTATNLLADASGYTEYRRIGSVLTDGSSNIVDYTQVNNIFIWTVPEADYDAAAPTTAADLVLTVPIDVRVVAHIQYHFQVRDTAGTGAFWAAHEKDATDLAVSSTNALAGAQHDNSSYVGEGFGASDIVTDTSATIRHDASEALPLDVNTRRWYDFLGDNE